MPLLGTKGAASAQGFGFSGVTGPADVSFISYTNSLVVGNRGLVATAANNAGYVAACFRLGSGGSTYAVAIALFLPNGELGFLKSFPSSQYDGTMPFSVCMDDANIYVVWSDYNPLSSLDRILVSSITIATGNVNWNANTGISYNNGGFKHAIANGASGELVLAGIYSSDVYYVARLNKSDGSVVASFTQNRSGTKPVNVGYNTNGIYFAYGTSLIRFATTLGSMTARRTLGDEIFSLALAPSGNVYLGLDGSKIASINSTLATTNWTRLVSGTQTTAGVAADASNNFYAAYSNKINKLNSSGTLSFSRGVSYFSVSPYNGTPQLVINDAQMCGSLNPFLGSGVLQVGAFKLPQDGSGTGTYGAISYSTESDTYSSSSLTNSSATTQTSLGGIGGTTQVSKSFLSTSATITKFTI